MKDMDSRVARMKTNPTGVKFRELVKICDFYFGFPRHYSSSHHVYSTLGKVTRGSTFKRTAAEWLSFTK